MSDQARRRVGVDLDGVLADQITGVLPRVNERHGLDLTYDDITDWRLPTGSSNIATEIVASLQEQEYVRRMAVHSGAAEMLAALVSRYEVVVLTAREGETLEWSVDWLRVHDLPFSEVIGASEAHKSRHGVDALIDDYIGNVQELLANTKGVAILVDQPWKRSERAQLIAYESRFLTVDRLVDVPAALERLLSRVQAGGE